MSTSRDSAVPFGLACEAAAAARQPQRGHKTVVPFRKLALNPSVPAGDATASFSVRNSCGDP